MNKVKLLHITRTENITSINKTGLLRSPPPLQHHADLIERRLCSNYDGKVSYFLEPKERWIKDFAYWATFGVTRNKYLKNLTEWDASKIGHELPLIKNNYGDFSLLECNVDEDFFLQLGNHVQTSDMQINDNGFEWGMDTRYEHDDKPLIVSFFDKINPENIKQVGVVKTRENKSGKIDMFLNW